MCSITDIQTILIPNNEVFLCAFIKNNSAETLKITIKKADVHNQGLYSNLNF